ncbi:MAG: 6-pyruvoyl trahydropterin synthase family protein [Candidatus Kryptoniota bacterium]
MRKMYQRIERSFHAAHYIAGHPEKCRQLHGHTYRVVVTFACPFPAPDGYFAVDFSELHRRVDLCLPDHRCLNEAYATSNATAEMIALKLGEAIIEAMQGLPVELKQLEVWETPTAAVVVDYA